jgi:hypothetical protein
MHINTLPVGSTGVRLLYDTAAGSHSHISPPNSSWTPGVFDTYFYNRACRLRLEKLLYLELPRSPNGFLNCFWVQVAISLLKPLHGGFRSKTAVI